jgi:hypothetical protein
MKTYVAQKYSSILDFRQFLRRYNDFNEGRKPRNDWTTKILLRKTFRAVNIACRILAKQLFEHGSVQIDWEETESLRFNQEDFTIPSSY